MLDHEFKEWATFHSSCFGMSSDGDMETMTAWREVFESCGYHAGELRAASMAMASKNPPRWRTEHLAAIHWEIREARMQARRREDVEREDQGGYWVPCDLCQDTGFCIVPHPKSVHDGKWISPFYTVAVACFCSKGSKLVDSMIVGDEGRQEHRKLGQPLSLRTYELKNPFWKEQVSQAEAQRKAKIEAMNLSDSADKTLGPILMKLVERAKT